MHKNIVQMRGQQKENDRERKKRQIRKGERMDLTGDTQKT